MEIFKQYLLNEANVDNSSLQKALDYLANNAERIKQRPELAKQILEIKQNVMKVRTTSTGEKFVSDSMREKSEKALYEISHFIMNKILGWRDDGKGLISGKMGLKQINKVFDLNINEDRIKEIIFNRIFNSLGAADKKADKIIQTTKKINGIVSEMIKTGKPGESDFKLGFYVPKNLLGFDSIRNPIRTKILNAKLPKQLELYKKVSGKDFQLTDKELDENKYLSKQLKETIKRILKENK